MRYRFPKSSRLLKRRQFLRISNYGRRWVGRSLVIDVKKNRQSKTRLGITVTKRYGKAFQRNRFKRIVRESFRQLQHQLPIGIDLHAKPRYNGHSVTFEDVTEDLRLRFMKDPKPA